LSGRAYQFSEDEDELRLWFDDWLLAQCPGYRADLRSPRKRAAFRLMQGYVLSRAAQVQTYTAKILLSRPAL